ncbi:hypothetical protein D3C81_09860 [compost metagenome]
MDLNVRVEGCYLKGKSKTSKSATYDMFWEYRGTTYKIAEIRLELITGYLIVRECPLPNRGELIQALHKIFLSLGLNSSMHKHLEYDRTSTSVIKAFALLLIYMITMCGSNRQLVQKYNSPHIIALVKDNNVKEKPAFGLTLTVQATCIVKGKDEKYYDMILDKYLQKLRNTQYNVYASALLDSDYHWNLTKEEVKALFEGGDNNEKYYYGAEF